MNILERYIRRIVRQEIAKAQQKPAPVPHRSSPDRQSPHWLGGR